jgi:hypothetical protein
MIANNAARFCHIIAAILAAHFIRGRSDDRGVRIGDGDDELSKPRRLKMSPISIRSLAGGRPTASLDIHS